MMRRDIHEVSFCHQPGSVPFVSLMKFFSLLGVETEMGSLTHQIDTVLTADLGSADRKHKCSNQLIIESKKNVCRCSL